MSEENRKLIASNLVRFREIQEKSQQELALASGVSLSCIQRIEQGLDDSLNTSSLIALAYALKRPVCDFYRAEKTISNVRFRAQKMKPIQRAAIVESCAKRLERYCFLENELNQREEFVLTPLVDGGSVDIPELARKTRERLGIAQNIPIENVVDVLQKSRIKFWFDSKIPYEGIFGLAVSQSPQATGVVVFKNQGVTVERQFFSAVHELGHLLLHKSSFETQIVEENKEEEKEADRFASYFLVPRDHFIRCWNKTKDEPFVIRVLRIKRYFHVSYQTILHRLVDERLYGNDVYKSFSIQYRSRYGGNLKNHYEPKPLSAVNVPDRFEQLVFEAVRQGVISFSRAAEFLEITVSELYNKFSSNGDVEIE